MVRIPGRLLIESGKIMNNAEPPPPSNSPVGLSFSMITTWTLRCQGGGGRKMGPLRTAPRGEKESQTVRIQED